MKVNKTVANIAFLLAGISVCLTPFQANANQTSPNGNGIKDMSSFLKTFDRQVEYRCGKPRKIEGTVVSAEASIFGVLKKRGAYDSMPELGELGNTFVKGQSEQRQMEDDRRRRERGCPTYGEEQEYQKTISQYTGNETGGNACQAIWKILKNRVSGSPDFIPALQQFADKKEIPVEAESLSLLPSDVGKCAIAIEGVRKQTETFPIR